MKLRLAGGENYVPHRLGRKSEVTQLANLIGVKTPKRYAVANIEDVLSSDLPDEFVLKPLFASTSIGVNILRRTEDRFIDLMSGDQLTRDLLIEQARSISLRFLDDERKGEYIAEELLRDHEGAFPPPDIRAYTFQGEIGMILKEHHLTAPARAMYFDGDFLPFHDVHNRYGVARGMEKLESIEEAVTPENWQNILRVAKRVSTSVPSAFCRVDMYDAQGGIYLGEITLLPGTFYYQNRKLMSQSEAERLGRMWTRAKTRLEGTAETWK
nr:ATP-grasp fold amidoligase family protein [Brevibacterium renqingii]